MTCTACERLSKDLPLDGATHSCERSGTATAELAYDAGAVSQVDALPLFDVACHFTVSSVDEADVKEKLVPLVTDLLCDDDVIDAHFTVTRR